MTIKIRIKSLEEIEANFAKSYKEAGLDWKGIEEGEVAEWEKHCGKTYEVEESEIINGIVFAEMGIFIANEYEIV